VSKTKLKEEKLEMKKLTITIPTQKAIAEFFLKTSVPKILRRIRESK